MGESNKKGEQLGMNFSTACHRLRMRLLFKYIVKAGDNICFRCGEEIERAEDMSMDHKIAWMNNGLNSADLFWNLDNIAFSHKRCNRKDYYLYTKATPKGTKWCPSCKSTRILDEFTKDKSRSDGLEWCCRGCRSIRRKEAR